MVGVCDNLKDKLSSEVKCEGKYVKYDVQDVKSAAAVL